MSFMDIYMIVPSAFVSGLIWFVILAVLLYIAREPAHQAINALSRVLHNAMRLSACGQRLLTVLHGLRHVLLQILNARAMRCVAGTGARSRRTHD